MSRPARRLTGAITLLLLLAACTSSAPSAGLPAPRASVAARASATPTEPPAPSAGPTAIVTNKPSVRTEPGATPTPSPTPTPVPVFGTLAIGQTNDFDGLDPLLMDLPAVGDLSLTDDGTLWFAADHRVWKLPPGGAVALVAGRHGAPSATLDGVAALEAGFGVTRPLTLHPDGGKTLLLSHGQGLTRLQANGTLQALWTRDADETALGFVREEAGAVALLVRKDVSPLTYAWWTARPDASAIRRRAVVGEEASTLGSSQGESYYNMAGNLPLGAEAGGKLYVVTRNALKSLLPAGGNPVTTGLTGVWMVDDRARAYQYSESTGALTILAVGKAPQVLAAKFPAGFIIRGIASATDGTVYAAGEVKDAVRDVKRTRIYRLSGDSTDLVAGVVTPALGLPEATSIRPRSVVRADDGHLILVDALRGRLLSVAPGQAVTALTGDPKLGSAPTDGSAAASAALKPDAVCRDKVGNLYVLSDRHDVWRLDATGTLKRVYVHDVPNETLESLAVAPDGTAYVHVAGLGAATRRTARVLRIDEAGAGQAVPLGGTSEFGIAGLSINADGALCAALYAGPAPTAGMSELKLVKVSITGKVDAVTSRAWRDTRRGGLALLAVDAQGRWLIATGDGGAGDRIARFDPADGTSGAVAGLGATRLGADTTDGGLTDIYGLTLDADGTAFVADERQVKRITGL